MMCVCSYHVHTPMNLQILSHITQKHTFPNMPAAHSCPQTERETHKQGPAMYTLCTHLHVLTCASIQAHSDTHTHACRTQKYSHRYTNTSTQTTTNINVHTLMHTAAPTPKHMQLRHTRAHSCTNPGTPCTHKHTRGSAIRTLCTNRYSHMPG